jgi:N-acyl homoserine lactone hydrolase
MRLYLMNLGGGGTVGGYLIQTDDGKNVLVDTGYPEEHYTKPEEGFSEQGWVVNQLAQLGLKPDDIDYVIATHLDVDHAGSHDAFPKAEFVVQDEHLKAAKEMPRFQRIREHWDHPDVHYRVVQGDTELLPGIELIETSGHVPGHQAVLVRLPQTGPVLLAIDAIPRNFEGFTPETRPTGQFDNDPEGARRSTRKLVDLAEREGATLTVYGHDSDQWQNLKTAPEYYE